MSSRVSSKPFACSPLCTSVRLTFRASEPLREAPRASLTIPVAPPRFRTLSLSSAWEEEVGEWEREG